jgi:hypothetical protein
MRFHCLSILILFSICSFGQYKSYRLSSNGDTLNRIDLKGQKQGKWMIHAEPLRGEPGYEEEGIFLNDRKEGIWRRFNLMGDLLAVEGYKWGNKNGLSKYYTIIGPEHEESWRALNPDKGFDTIDVRDPVNPDKYERVIVKNEGNSLKHGTWRFFYPKTGQIIGTEKYFLDKLVLPGTEDSTSNQLKVNTDTTKAKTPEKTKPKEVAEYEKKTSGKKKALRDGRTGG